jgi:hypothetical protein
VNSTIRAEIENSDQCTAEGRRTVRASAPVLAMCRELIAAGFDPDRPLEGYRGDVLALRIRSIGEGAKLTVAEGPNGPFFRRWIGQETPTAASPMRPVAEAASEASEAA